MSHGAYVGFVHLDRQLAVYNFVGKYVLEAQTSPVRVNWYGVERGRLWEITKNEMMHLVLGKFIEI